MMDFYCYGDIKNFCLPFHQFTPAFDENTPAFSLKVTRFRIRMELFLTNAHSMCRSVKRISRFVSDRLDIEDSEMMENIRINTVETFIFTARMSI